MERKIGIMGLWHLGCVMTAGLVECNNQIIAFDMRADRIENLIKGRSPIFEPDLDERLQLAIAEKKLCFTTNIYDLNEVELIWITVDTKLDDEDNCDLTEIMQYVSMLQKSGICKDLIVSSQVPCGTCKEIVHILDNAKINVAYVPENFQLGKSLAYFKKNNTWEIGSDCKEYAKKIKQIINKWCEKPNICNLETAEMVKHAINAFLATTISFSNALAEICVQMGADAYKVAEIMQLDNRIGNGLPLLPGPWFSGGTLARDVKILDSICNKESPVESFFKSIIDINNTRIQYLLDRIETYTSLKNKNVCILGAIYKANTNTLRRSPGLQMHKYLKEYGMKKIAFYDELISGEDKALLGEREIFCYKRLDQAIEDSDILIILRNDIAEEIKKDNYISLTSGKLILDIPNSLEKLNLTQHGMIVTPGRTFEI